MLDLALSSLASPVILFFVLGFVSALARVDLSLPQPVAKTIAVYLMLAIGFKGGVGIAESGFSIEYATPLAIGILFSAALPYMGYRLLRVATRLDNVDAAAVAAHYGSISIVTFLTASQILTDRGQEPEGIVIAIAAAMEAPAIVTGLWLASRTIGADAGVQDRTALPVREAFLNSSVFVLLGALCIGWFTGQDGLANIEAFIVDPFKGVLCLFLLDIGAVAGRGLAQNRNALDGRIFMFGLYMPVLSAAIMALALWPVPMSVSGKTLMLVLAASASYIAVPAAMRLALPQANPVIYTTLSLGITFPFNIIVGIPLYVTVAEFLFA
ncbi:MAG: sodium-dependent bicarbonate transport family permease [Rhodospirillaceae bacterium]|nr:sodium-dependent bicarbonate transport family permease [Rhodospirillaceae bacterium]MDD9913716.1 sodium-dependent bicarbonate transport family permease [Rhodospirillaceae bacterium]